MRLLLASVSVIMLLGACVWSEELESDASGHTGSIVVWQSEQQSGVAVSFSWTEPPEDPGCTPLDDRCVYCTVRPHEALVEQAPDAEQVLYAVRAGALHIRSRFEQLALRADDAGQYPSVMFPEGPTVFPAGDSLVIAADGGADIPAFEQVLQTPPSVLLTSPPLDDSPTISVQQPLRLAWAGGGQGELTVFLESSEPTPSPTVHLLTCSYDAQQAQATIPSQYLKRLPRSEDPEARPGALSYAISTEQSVKRGDWTLKLRAQNTVARADVFFE
jgi:hypothetical protein